MNAKNKDRLIIAAFLVIPLLLLLVFSYYPIVKLFQLSVSDWNGMTTEINYVGMKNFKDIFTQKEFFAVFLNNMAYIITAVAQQIVGLLLAILLDSNLKGKKGFRGLIFMPYIINGIAIAFMFNYMYDFEKSPVNTFLRSVGLGHLMIHFLGADYASNFSLSFISFWRYVGYTMVIFLAALQSIPKDIYEAARVDGANFYQLITKITLPNMKTMIQISLILSINGALQAYFEPFILTKGGPSGRTDTFITKTLSLAFDYNKFGKAAAMGVILLFIILAIVAVQQVVFKEKES